MQKHLKTGYGKTVKILDALVALCVIEIVEEKPIKYKRLCEKSEIRYGREIIGRQEAKGYE
jgi:hypothetical protein